MTSTIPTVSDRGRRALRTAVQVILAVASFATIYPTLVTAIGAPTGSRLGLWLGIIGVWLTVAAAVVAAVMAVPGVDKVLTVLGVGSISPRSVQVVLRDLAADVEPALEVAAPVIASVAPEVAPVIEKVEDIAAALVDPTPTPTTAPPAAVTVSAVTPPVTYTA